MGRSLNRLMLYHEPKLKDYFANELNIDIREQIRINRPSILWFDEAFTAPYFGYKSREDYYT